MAIVGPEDRSNIFTDARGEARLLRLPVGTYEVSVALAGFRTFIDTGVQVRAASSTPLVATLEVGGLEETVIVSGTAPIIDPRRQNTDTHVTLKDLQGLPSARDPWVRAPNNPRRHRRPRQRGRVGIRPTVELHGQGCQQQREHVDAGTAL